MPIDFMKKILLSLFMGAVVFGVGGCQRTPRVQQLSLSSQSQSAVSEGKINKAEESIKPNSKEISANVNEYGVAESVVAILCPFADEPFDLLSSGYGGSGTILSEDGIIITNS